MFFVSFASRPRCARNKSDKQSGRLAIPCGNSWTRGKEGDEISSQIVGRDEAEKVRATGFRAMDSLEQLPKRETIRLRKRHVGVILHSYFKAEPMMDVRKSSATSM
uniref:Uncharacterized protein n=1 Tax=Timema bartmani TaxID=61472 RepID=A0A7R9EX25_9NEOP|nr:unnamed protein product [Timema bartmani]